MCPEEGCPYDIDRMDRLVHHLLSVHNYPQWHCPECNKLWIEARKAEHHCRGKKRKSEVSCGNGCATGAPRVRHGVAFTQGDTRDRKSVV